MLQTLEQVQNLRLDGHIQRGHRLIAENQFRAQDQRTGDAYPLTLTAGKFMWKAVIIRRFKADDAHGFLRDFRRLRASFMP